MSHFRARANHVLFWVLFLNVAFVYSAINSSPDNALTLAGYLRQYTSLYAYVEYGRIIGTCYLSLWVFTHWSLPKNVSVTFLQVVALGILDATLSYVLSQKIVGPLTGHWQAPPSVTAARFIFEDLTVSWLYVMMAFLFKHLRDHHQTEALRHEKNAIELAYLKSQLNPHFLFNSMNNLYGLALTEPARTPDAILKLAELMRYMLYESNETQVALAREVEYLSNYIALEKLRHEGETHVEFAVEGPVEGRQIAPLLLIAFVENAFKHGGVANAARPIRLHLALAPGRLTFTAENQVVSKNKDQVGGVGLVSVRRRLALLYPGRHELRIRQEADQFSCVLRLQTNEAAAPAAGASTAQEPSPAAGLADADAAAGPRRPRSPRPWLAPTATFAPPTP